MRASPVLLLVAACASAPPAPSAPDTLDYPGELRPPGELTPDFAVEQHVEIRRGAQSGGFDAVLQKQGDTLVLVGLGPLNTRALVLRQEGAVVHFEQSMGPPLPFPPRNVLVDVHRAFFKRLNVPPTGESDGTHRGEIDGETVTEVWRAGALVERSFERPSFRSGRVRVRYGAGCTRTRCEPATIHLSNEWFGYELTIDNRRFHSLQKS